MNGDRRGVAVVMVLLLLLGGTALAHGTLLVARGELLAARARASQLERASEEGLRVREALEMPMDPSARSTPVWGVWPLDGPIRRDGRRPVLRRLAVESWFLEWPPVSGGPRSVGEPGRLLWWMDPVERVRDLSAVVVVGPEVTASVAGSIDPGGFRRADPPLTTALCDSITRGFSGLESPAPVASWPEASSRPRLGLVDLEAMLDVTPLHVEGAGTPVPTERMGDCVTADPWNWGDPVSPGRPCGPHLVVRAARSTLRVRGGIGQGVLAVDGDLVLTEGARFYGFVIVSGSLVLRDASEMYGLALALGGVEVDAGARIEASACWAIRSLGAAAAVWTPHPVPVPTTFLIGP